MSREVPPAKEGEEPSASLLDPAVREVLRRLLVGELELKVDPVSGRALLDGKAPPPQDRP